MHEANLKILRLADGSEARRTRFAQVRASSGQTRGTLEGAEVHMGKDQGSIAAESGRRHRKRELGEGG